MSRTHKNVILNDMAIAVLDKISGKSYSDKVLLLADQTRSFQDTHFKFKFAELKIIYPDLVTLLDKNEQILCELFAFLQDLPDSEKVKQLFIFENGFTKLSNLFYKHITQQLQEQK